MLQGVVDRRIHAVDHFRWRHPTRRLAGQRAVERSSEIVDVLRRGRARSRSPERGQLGGVGRRVEDRRRVDGPVECPGGVKGSKPGGETGCVPHELINRHGLTGAEPVSHGDSSAPFANAEDARR